MILVTGATGHLGGSIIRHLLTNLPGNQIIALVRDESKATGLRAAGVIVRQGNYHNAASLKAAFSGVTKAVLVSSNDFDDRLGQHRNVIHAASEAGLEHFIYTGVSLKNVNGSALRDLMADHFQTEDHVRESGLPYTFMQNNLYSEMIPFYIGDKALEKGIFFPAGDGKIPFALRDEMGEAIANVLTENSHLKKVYNIANTVSYSFHDIAKYLSELSGKAITYTAADPEVFLNNLRNSHLPEKMQQVFTGFATAMRNGDFDLPGTDLQALLHRKPADLKQYLKKEFIDQ